METNERAGQEVEFANQEPEGLANQKPKGQSQAQESLPEAKSPATDNHSAQNLIHNQSEKGPYGPWMLVKRPPRRKKDFQKDNKSQKDSEPERGSRFALLQNSEKDIDTNEADFSQPKRSMVSSKPVISQPESSKATRIRNPSAGKITRRSRKNKQATKKDMRGSQMLTVSIYHGRITHH
ncbi:hypothetical protein SESBI_26554 [Sesbania bispinosa]|nr:hypothetical protein SESBI_26554 [Sesbania bispinosa]